MNDATIKSDTMMFDIFDYDKYDEYLRDIGHGLIFHDDDLSNLPIIEEHNACELFPQVQSDGCYHGLHYITMDIHNKSNSLISPTSFDVKEEPILMKQLNETPKTEEITEILHPLKKKRKLAPGSEMIKHGRLCTGVTFHPKTKKFRARIKVDGRTTHLGYFDTEMEAALAYDRAAYELRGDNALFNFGTPPSSNIHHDYAGMSMKERCKRAACSVYNNYKSDHTQHVSFD